MMNPLQKIRTSFSKQLSLWVAGFVLATLGVVIFLLVSFSEGVIRDETIDATLQALENAALRIDNTLRQSEMTARLEGQRFRVGRSRVERLLDESSSQKLLQQLLPNAQFFVTRRDSSQLDTYITGSKGGCRQLVHEGRAQVLMASLHGLPQEEVVDITGRMSQSATDITRLTHELREVANSHD